MIYYISGKISDTTLQREKENIAKFTEMAAILIDQGYEVHNPADFTIDEFSWEEYLARDLKWISDNKPTLYMLQGWEDSLGARLEFEFARLLNLEIQYEPLDV
jgi:hypothetical protein